MTSICLHPEGIKWKDINARAYGEDVTLIFDDVAISIFSGNQSTLRTVNCLVDRLLSLAGELIQKENEKLKEERDELGSSENVS